LTNLEKDEIKTTYVLLLAIMGIGIVLWFVGVPTALIYWLTS
tara:strand:+ start:2991 stop:3116 length:126 start_codon:yes stop_codon:yes gene_type:complete